MELQHFSHEHPLVFIKDAEFYNEDGNIHCCEGCMKPMVSITPSYSCPECHFYLHKSCAELPQQKTHPLHPQHPLTLLPKPLYGGSLCSCDCCHSNWGNFTYNCSLCQFDLDIVCATQMDHNFDHPCHKHPLTRLKKPVLTECDGCGVEHKGIFYVCNTCPFMIHHYCLSLPFRIDCQDHPEHLLTLAYCIPPQYTRFWEYCEICTKEINDDYSVYYCGECKYFVHTNCATSTYEPFMSILHPWTRAEWAKFKVDTDRPGIVKMPVSDEFVNLISHFGQSDMVRLKQRESRMDDPFIHFSHSHPLVLFEKDNEDDDNKLISQGKCCHLHNEKNDRLLCSGCINPIITILPFYRCIEKCGFFLHTSCAELPAEIQHPGHPQHALILLPRSHTPLGLFQCKGCSNYCNGFAYSCTNCDEYYLDVICGNLPKSIQHEAHKDHVLSIKSNISTRCRATNISNERASSLGFSFAYGCESCNYELLPYVTLWPQEIRHRYDEKHRFILTYSPVNGTHHSGQYLCDVCEEELNPKWWFYHCVDCDHSIHDECLPQLDDRSHIKYGGTYTIHSHPHPLALLPVIEPNTFFFSFPHVITENIDCDTNGICSHSAAASILKCLECTFYIHRLCAVKNGDFDALID